MIKKVQHFICGLGDQQEKIDYGYLEMLTLQYNEYFRDLEQTDLRAPYDAVCRDENGKKMCIELKARNSMALCQADCFIELNKWRNMLSMSRKEEGQDMIPLYINFFEGNRFAYIWRLDKLKGTVKFYPNINIGGYECDRIGLRWEDAWIMKMDKEGRYHLEQVGVEGDKSLLIQAKERQDEKEEEEEKRGYGEGY